MRSPRNRFRSLPLSLVSLEDRAVPNAGAIDPFFGVDGRAIFDTTTTRFSASVVQPSGKIISVGYDNFDPNNINTVIVRHNFDGTLDSTFGGGGSIYSDMSAIASGGVSNGEDRATAVTVTADGIIVAGYHNSQSKGRDGFVLRLDANGKEVATFGTGGYTFFGLDRGGNFNDTVSAVALAASGEILVAGTSTYANSDTDFFVVKLSATGQNIANGIAAFDLSGSNADVCNAMAIDSLGNVILAGTARNSGGTITAVARFTSDLNLDNTFSSDGILTVPLADIQLFETCNAVAVDSFNRILVAGSAEFSLVGDSGIDASIVRFNTDGTLDSSFNGGGKLTLAFDRGGSNFDSSAGLFVQSNGKIVFAGGASGDPIMARLNDNGSFDASFGTNGVAVCEVTPGETGVESAVAVIREPGGTYLLTASTPSFPGEKSALVRVLDTALVSDLVVNSTVDENDGDLTSLSLREAVALSNLFTTADAITFDPALADKTITLTKGELKIKDSTTIFGPATRLTVSGNNASRVFNIDDDVYGHNATVNISNLIITGGNDIIGGGILLDDENLELDNVLLVANFADRYGAGLTTNSNPNGRLVIRNSAIVDNSSGNGSSAGLYLSNCSLLIENSTLTGNESGNGSGGAAIDFSGVVGPQGATIRNTTISNNRVGSTNTATTAAGGVSFSSLSGTVNLENCTITGNTSNSQAGGGITLYAGSGTVNLHNTVVSGNFVGGVARDVVQRTPGTSLRANFSAIGTNPSFSLAAGSDNNIPFGTNAKLTPLDLTTTPPVHYLFGGSPLINAGDPATTSADVFGTPVRVGRRDIGAIEFDPKVAEYEFSVGSDKGTPSSVTLFNPDSSKRLTLTPFGNTFTGGIRTASGDVTGDGVADLIVASGPGMPGTVKVFDGVTQQQIPLPETVAGGGRPFGETFTRGIIVATGDLNADGLSDLIITAEAGGGARVRIFTSSGSGFSQRSDFIALIGGDNVPDSKIFRGGSRATISDINGDGYGDLIWAAGAGGGPRIATFNGRQLNAGSNVSFKLTGDFFALGDTSLRDGCFLAGGDLNGDSIGDIAFGGGSGAPPIVVVHSGAQLAANIVASAGNASTLQSKAFFTTTTGVNSKNGLRVAVKDLNQDNVADLILGSAPGAGSHIVAYDGREITLGNSGAQLLGFDAFANFTGGVFVG